MGSGVTKNKADPKLVEAVKLDRAVAAEVIPAGQDEVAEEDELMVPVDMLSISVPDIPGDVGLCGNMSPDLVPIIAKRFKSWIYMNKEDNPNFHRKMIEEAGCQVEVAFFPGPPTMPSEEQVAAALDALDRMPRPVMLQCNTGMRVGAALLLWLAKRRGYTAESAAQLGHDTSLRFFTNCLRCGPMREWVLQQLPGVSEVLGQQSGDLVFRQLFDEPTCTFTYILGDAETKESVLIDPVLEQKDRDLAILRELGLELKYVINTHCHADHVTSGGVIRKELPHVKTIIAKASGAQADIHIEEGSAIQFGKFVLETLSTPGHTDGCVTYLLRDGPGMLFTGDALLIRGCGRTDFQAGDAGVLYESVHTKIFSQPPETLIYPGHDYKGRNVSTVAEEQKFNTRLTQSKDNFIKLMSELNLPYPKRIDVALPANLVCGVQD